MRPAIGSSIGYCYDRQSAAKVGVVTWRGVRDFSRQVARRELDDKCLVTEVDLINRSWGSSTEKGGVAT